MADLDATAEKLHILAAPDCTCQQCTFIRNAYACHCPRCGRRWQAAFATFAEAVLALALHSADCLKAEQARAKRQKVRVLKPTWYPVVCGWCGQSWPKRFTTYKAGQRFLRSHTQMCYLRLREHAHA